MGHRNLSDNINERLDSPNEGVFLRDLKPGDTVVVNTQNSRYMLILVEDQKVLVEGNGRYFNEPTECYVNGSTWGGSMIKVGFIGVNMVLEFAAHGTERISTSWVQSIQVIPDSKITLQALGTELAREWCQ